MEGFAVTVVVVEEAVDGGLKLTTDRKMPRFSSRLLNVAKKPSTALSHH